MTRAELMQAKRPVYRTEPVEIHVLWNPSDSSRNRRDGRNWRAGIAIKKGAATAAEVGWMLAGRPQFAVKVRVSVTRWGSRDLDECNLIDGCKPVMDALFRASGCGVTADDGPRYLTLGTITQVRCKRGDERVVFHVEPA